MRLSEDPETKDVLKRFLHDTLDTTVADSNLRLESNIQFLRDHGADDLAEELPLWWNRGTKRMRGNASEEPLDDRPDIYFQAALYHGYGEYLIRSTEQGNGRSDHQGGGH